MDTAKATTARADRRGNTRSKQENADAPAETPQSANHRIENLDREKSTGKSPTRRSPLVLVPLIAALCFLVDGSAGGSSNHENSLAASLVGPVKWLGRRLRPGNQVPACPSVDSRQETEAAPVDLAGRLQTTGQLTEQGTVVDPVVAAVDARIRREALRQLDSLDLDDIDARIEPLWALSAGVTDLNADDDDEDYGILDIPPSRRGGATGPGPEGI